MNCTKLYNRLIDIGLVKPSQAAKDYVDLIATGTPVSYWSRDSSDGTEKHHIIPRYWYKVNKTSVDNTNINVVRLSNEKHRKAHDLLMKCVSEEYVDFELRRNSFCIKKEDQISDILCYIKTNNITDFAEFVFWCMDNKREWLPIVYNNDVIPLIFDEIMMQEFPEERSV